MAKKTKKSKKNGIAALMDELFQAAVALRGPIETPDYKRYVLPLIFLRFLSLRYENRRAELERLIDDPESDWHATDPGVREAILEDPDAYEAAGAFIVPKEARWSELVAQAQVRDEMQSDDQRARELGLEEDELAFYDAIAANFGQVYEQDFLRDLIHDVVVSIKRNLKVDWTEPHRRGVRAAVRVAVKNVLRKRAVKGADLEGFVSAVMEQAEASFHDWPLAA